jgi:uncharacterized membrane protein (DUF4010 family)
VLESISLTDATRLAIALGIGLLIGAERERRMAERGRRGTAGIRTFALVSVLGGVSAQTGQVAVVVAVLAFVGAATLIGYSRDPGELGITSEVALVATCLLGVLAQDEPALASAVAVAVTILLLTRGWLHRFVSTVLTEQEIHDALILAASALVVLPLLPDEAIGPGQAINPFSVWRLVVLLMAIGSAGYVAVRAAGARFGLAFAGLLGGFVSSTATIGAMGARVREQPALQRAATSGALFSTVATFAQLAVVLATISTEALRTLTWPLLSGGAAAAALAGLAVIGTSSHDAERRFEYGRAFDLRTATVLALVITAVTVLSAAASEFADERGLLVAAALGGFGDAHAAAIGVASVVSAGRLPAEAATLAVLGAISSNTVSKLVAASIRGGSRFALLVGTGLALILAAAWAGSLLPAP